MKLFLDLRSFKTSVCAKENIKSIDMIKVITAPALYSKNGKPVNAHTNVATKQNRLPTPP
jgi:hypothetical protein